MKAQTSLTIAETTESETTTAVVVRSQEQIIITEWTEEGERSHQQPE